MIRSSIVFLFLVWLVDGSNVPVSADQADLEDSSGTIRPKLQFINGSDRTIEVFWEKDDGQRVSNGSIQPGHDLIVTTTIGHRFSVVDREDQSEVIVESQVPIQGYRFHEHHRESGGIPVFYTQHVDADGFPIVASDRVNAYALKEAAYIVNAMLAERPDIREAIIRSGARLSIMAYDEFTTDLPEFARLASEPNRGFPQITAKDFSDARARGTGGSETDPFCSCAEENLLGFPGDPYEQECILIHEFAHCIHLRGMVNIDATFDRRLKETYNQAMRDGLWKGKYASVNHHEYFAEGVQSWFDNNRINDHDHNHVNTRELLIEYDPGLAAICREVFGDTAMTYTKPTTRLRGHMSGYDPASAPTFRWPKRLTLVKAEIMAKIQQRDPIDRKLSDRKLSDRKLSDRKPARMKCTEITTRRVGDRDERITGALERAIRKYRALDIALVSCG